MANLPKLITAHTAAMRLGVTPADFAGYRSRDDFPPPALIIDPREAGELTAPLLLWREADIHALAP